MKILAINSSGRVHGNNENILKCCLQAFEENNDQTEFISLKNLNIEGCKSCYRCKKDEDKCVIKDDMANVSRKVMASDLLVMGMPLYMWQITAQAKLFMERLYPFFHFDRPSDLKGKKLILIFTQAAADEKMFEAYFRHIEEAMAFLGFDVLETIVFAGLREADDYTRYPGFSEKITGIKNCIQSDHQLKQCR